MMELIFIYNAKGGPLYGALDYAHKLFSPNTYQCDLCALTYGHTGMRKKWKVFLNSLGLPYKFLHKADLLNIDTKGVDYKIPCVLLKDGDNITLVYSQEDFQKTNYLDELIKNIKMRLKNIE